MGFVDGVEEDGARTSFRYRKRCDRRVSSNNHGAGWGIQPCQRLVTEGTMGYGDRDRGRGRQDDGKYVRLTGLWENRNKRGMFTGKIRNQDIQKIMRKFEECDDKRADVVVFLWENNNKRGQKILTSQCRLQRRKIVVADEVVILTGTEDAMTATGTEMKGTTEMAAVIVVDAHEKMNGIQVTVKMSGTDATKMIAIQDVMMTAARTNLSGSRPASKGKIKALKRREVILPFWRRSDKAPTRAGRMGRRLVMGILKQTRIPRGILGAVALIAATRP